MVPVLSRGAPPQSVQEFIKSDSEWESLRKGEVVILPTEDGDSTEEDNQHAGMAAILIDAAPKEVWDVIADKEAAPDYIDSLESAEIIEETEDHVLIRQTMKLGPLPRVTYVVKHSPIPIHTVNFEHHSGDMKDIKGFWRFFPVDGDKKCLVIYRLSLSPGFFVPNFVIRKSLKKSLPDALRAVERQVSIRKE
ncbi:MAG: SRPBCC family protein [Verrucomicrobiae bacterium]|nr:SRPBCC family protein [Verrucomicrobiae bacterium]